MRDPSLTHEARHVPASTWPTGIRAEKEHSEGIGPFTPNTSVPNCPGNLIPCIAVLSSLVHPKHHERQRVPELMACSGGERTHPQRPTLVDVYQTW